MKKIILGIVVTLTIVSCGKENKNDKQSETISTEEVKKDEYVVLLDAIYEKNDSVTLYVYDEIGNGYLDKTVKVPVVGSPLNQVVKIDFPKDVDIYNIAIGFSTNKSQESFTLKSITLLKNEKEIITAKDYLYFFANNDQMVLNLETGKHQLKHEQVYQPAFGGNEQMKALLQE